MAIVSFGFACAKADEKGLYPVPEPGVKKDREY